MWLRKLFRRMADRLLTQLVLALVAPTLLIGLLIGAPLAASRRAALLAQEQLRATQMGQAAALLFTERLHTAIQITRLLAERQMLTEQINTKNSVQIGTFLTETRSETPFECLALVDSIEQVLAQSGTCALDLHLDQLVSLRTIPDQGWFAQLRVPLRHNPSNERWLISVLPIDRGLVELAQRQPDLELGVVINNQVIASSLPAHINNSLVHFSDDAPAEIHIDRQPYLAHYVPLPDLSGTTVAYAEVLLPLNRIRAAQNQVTLIVLAGTGVAILVAIALGWLMARRISQAIARVSQSAAAIGSGDLAHSMHIHGPQELRHLSTAIDDMRVQLAQSRQLLEDEKQRYLDILESIDEAVITLSPDQLMTSLNQGAEHMFGCRRSDDVGKALSTILTMADGRPMNIMTIPRQGPIRIAVQTATHKRLTVSATCATQAGKDGFILVMRDVSDNETINQLKDAFLANITHELRTPLAAQIASLEILREENDTLTADERQQMLNALHNGVQRLDLLVQNLLDSASIEAGYFHVEPEPCQLEPIIHEALTLMEPLVRRRNQSIHLQLADPLPAVLADGRRMVQVLVNLLANASKFGPINDTILLCMQPEQPNMLCITVTDHGAGIASIRRERLFERFLRPGADTVQAQGAGLGLAIVKAIMDRHGGQMRVDQAIPQGTTIVISLPCFAGDHNENTPG